MKYELAKELKDAGFPQECLPVFCDQCKKAQYNDEGLDMCYCEMKNYSQTYIPTLSELIEACGKCLSHIKRLNVHGEDYWWAVSHCGHPEHEWGGNNLEEQGKTPEEAVARLWLALNKKPRD